MIVIEISHTGENMLRYYRACLQRYNIERKQIISISADCARNGQKMIRLDQDDATEQPPPKKKAARRLSYEFTEDAMNVVNNQLQSDAQINYEIEVILATDEPTDDNALDIIFDECGISLDNSPSPYNPQHDELLTAIMPQVAREHGHDKCFNLSSIRCAAHTVQLVVKDSMKELSEESSNIIKICRRIAKILRLESTKYFLEEAGLALKKPKLDTETRWGSTFVMVSPFLITVPIIRLKLQKKTRIAKMLIQCPH